MRSTRPLPATFAVALALLWGVNAMAAEAAEAQAAEAQAAEVQAAEAQAAEAQAAEAQAAEAQAAEAQAAAVQTPAAAEPIALSDYYLSAWLMTEVSQQMSINELANKQAQRDEVKQLAQELIEDQRQLASRLHSVGLIAHRTEADLGPVLQVLAARVAQRIRQAAPGSDERVILGFRGSRAPAEAEAATEDAAEELEQQAGREVLSELREGRREVRDQRTEVRRERQDVQPLRRDDAAEERAEYREARDELRGARDRQRDQRREAIGEVLAEAGPVLRENLPLILDFVGRAIEQGSADSHGEQWIRLKHQLSERKAASIKNELQQRQGSDFDQAFLEYQCLAQVGMVDMLQVFQQHASPELRSTIDESLAAARDRLERVRQLLGSSADDAPENQSQESES
jgi:hypothetical protein